MLWGESINRSTLLNDPWARWVYQRPGWVPLAAGLTAFLVVVVPLMLLTIAAVLAGSVVFIVLSGVSYLLVLIRRLWSSLTGQSDTWADETDGPAAMSHGRRNVKVIYRDSDL